MSSREGRTGISTKSTSLRAAASPAELPAVSRMARVVPCSARRPRISASWPISQGRTRSTATDPSLSAAPPSPRASPADRGRGRSRARPPPRRRWPGRPPSVVLPVPPFCTATATTRSGPAACRGAVSGDLPDPSGSMRVQPLRIPGRATADSRVARSSGGDRRPGIMTMRSGTSDGRTRPLRYRRGLSGSRFADAPSATGRRRLSHQRRQGPRTTAAATCIDLYCSRFNAQPTARSSRGQYRQDTLTMTASMAPCFVMIYA